MKKIKELSKQIHEEIEDAENYIRMALQNKESDKDLGDLYCTLAQEELGHADRLHSHVVKEINKYKVNGKPVPEVMQGIWDWQHEEIVEETMEVKMMIEAYRKSM